LPEKRYVPVINPHDQSVLCAQIKKLAPIMKYYHHAWPIDAFLKQYLGSSAAKYRKDLQQLVALDEVPSLQKAATSEGANQVAENFISYSCDSDNESDANLETVDTVTTSTARVSYFFLNYSGLTSHETREKRPAIGTKL
jgi:hypothetical protein